MPPKRWMHMEKQKVLWATRAQVCSAAADFYLLFHSASFRSDCGFRVQELSMPWPALRWPSLNAPSRRRMTRSYTASSS